MYGGFNISLPVESKSQAVMIDGFIRFQFNRFFVTFKGFIQIIEFQINITQCKMSCRQGRFYFYGMFVFCLCFFEVFQIIINKAKIVMGYRIIFFQFYCFFIFLYGIFQFPFV
jgi:hypothetical protein